MASFDTVSKKQIEINPQDFVHLCFRFREVDTSVLEIVTPEQPTVEMHQADSLIKVMHNGREVLVHFEFQTNDSYDPDMPLRMAGYIIRSIEIYRLPVYSNVIYLRPDAGGNDPGKFQQNLENHNISIEYQVFRLIDLDGEKILDSKIVGLIPFTPLMRHHAGTSDEQWLRKCVQVADSIDVPNKAEYFGSLAILGNLIFDSQTILDIISEETMQHPSITEYTAPIAREQGIKHSTRKHILEVLEVRLGDDIAQTFKTTVESIDEMQRLELLFSAAIQVENADEFRQILSEHDK